MGTFFISPIVIKAYADHTVNLPTLWTANVLTANAFINNFDVAGYALGYVGVSVAIGLISGALMGFIMTFFKKTHENYDDSEVFNMASFGLR